MPVVRQGSFLSDAQLAITLALMPQTLIFGSRFQLDKGRRSAFFVPTGSFPLLRIDTYKGGAK